MKDGRRQTRSFIRRLDTAKKKEKNFYTRLWRSWSKDLSETCLHSRSIFTGAKRQQLSNVREESVKKKEKKMLLGVKRKLTLDDDDNGGGGGGGENE